MRLKNFTIGSPYASPTHQFKNLKNVTIDFDQDYWVTVMIGWNGTGKSNVLEALATIFCDLIGKKKVPKFAFQLAYQMGDKNDTRYIHIDADPDRTKEGKEAYLIYVTSPSRDTQTPSLFESVDPDNVLLGKDISFNTFVADESPYLPRYVFSYYSGESTRMQAIFRPYLESYYGMLLTGKPVGLKRLFYALPDHSHFVLLAFLTQPNETIRRFLEGQLGLDPEEGVESVLFILRQPPWKSKVGDSRFWNARGVVQKFLDRLYRVALAPIRVKRRVAATRLRSREEIEFLYLYVKDINALRQLIGNQQPAHFFRDLESTYASELIEEVRIQVRLKGNNGSVTFRELSEGEQQLLTVLGLLRFTAGEESLFLLDEPDTHLNPRWSVDYISYLKNFVGSESKNQETSHIVLTTHDPMSIAELSKEQVQILLFKHDESGRHIVACHPELDPRGQGYAAIVTSDMFGITSSLDRPTQELLEKQRLYAAKKSLSNKEQNDLDQLNDKLDRLGFRFFHPDDEYSRYLRLRAQKLSERFEGKEIDTTASLVMSMSREEREKLAGDLIGNLEADTYSDDGNIE